MYKIHQSDILGVFLIEPSIKQDNRGNFVEIYKESLFEELNLPDFVQDNISLSKKGVIRGFHFQSEPFAQGKLISVVQGQIFDVIVDIRPSSPTFGQHVTFSLTSSKHHMVYIPPGFAHGFCTLSDNSIVLYKNTKEFNSKYYHGIKWNDPDINIKWPLKNPIISEKDLKLRGAGEILGTRQSGEQSFRILDIDIHENLIKIADKEAKIIVNKDPNLAQFSGKNFKVLLYLFDQNKAINLIKSG